MKIVDDLGIYYKIGLTTDFTGKLFNEMYSWLGFTQDQLNDVVLTPSYVATLLCRLARVNKDSYVWDFATGSAGLLVAGVPPVTIVGFVFPGLLLLLLLLLLSVYGESATPESGYEFPVDGLDVEGACEFTVPLDTPF